MKKFIVRTVFNWIVLSSLILFPVASSALGIFTTDTGYLVIPEVDVNGEVFYDNVTLKLNFSDGTFELISADAKPDNISTTPLETVEEQDIKMDFMGCTRSGRNEVTCYVKLTSLGGFDRETAVYAESYDNASILYDNLGTAYKAVEVSIGNINSRDTRGVVSPILIAGIPTLATFTFDNISPDASSISLLKPTFRTGGDAGFGGGSGTVFTGDFRNIDF